MQSVAGRVPIREYELPTKAKERRHTEPHLIEERHDVYWMRGRALAAIDATRVSHVGLVICRVEIHTIPAAREEHLCS